MSRNHFESMMSFLHAVDKEREDQLKKDGDKLAKVRPLIDHINKKCQQLYQPHCEVSVDERMVHSKARFSFKQYIRNKPTKWSFKLWCFCDAHNGYTVRFSVYRGKTGELQSGNGLSYDVVMNLLEGYLDQGYSIYVDNYYTSPTLGFHLFDCSTHITGTLDRTRVGVPDEVKDLWAKMSPKQQFKALVDMYM